MLQSHLIDELTELSAKLTNSTLEQLALTFGLEDYYPDKQEGNILYSKWTNKPVKC